MEDYTCMECGKQMYCTEDVIEHLRKKKCFKYAPVDIRRPNALGEEDSHGNVWYCFSCTTSRKDHRSFQSEEAMLQHLMACHSPNIKRGHHSCQCLDRDYENSGQCKYCNLRR